MLILGIETSCDETAVAVIEASSGLRRPNFHILSNVVSSQVKLHAKYGGVVPTLAKREHQRNLAPILLSALREARFSISKSPPAPRLRRAGQFLISKQIPKFKIQKDLATYKLRNLETILEREPEVLRQFKKYVLPLNPPQIDAIAVTVGPGLEPALWVGVNFARALSYLWKKPIIPVNHLEGHIYSNWLEPVREISNSQFLISKRFRNRKIEFPAICLIVSGGHTELLLMKGYGKYKLLGETRDDAAGEAFDKVARLLGLGYPGGPAIDALASKLPITNYQLPIKLPRPMINSRDYDFSFSGLKTAVFYLVRDLEKSRGSSTPPFRNSKKGLGRTSKNLPVAAICTEFQQAVVDVLVTKTLRAAREYEAKTIMVSGGVAANSGLQNAFGKLQITNYKLQILFPPHGLITDNAAMIAMAGYFNRTKFRSRNWNKLAPDANLGIY